MNMMTKTQFELAAFLVAFQRGKGLEVAQTMAQDATDAFEARGAWDVDLVNIRRYEGPINPGPGAPLAVSTSPRAQVQNPNGGKSPGGQIVQAGGSRSSGQTRIVNMEGGNRQPEGRGNVGTRGPAAPYVGRASAPPVVVKVGQGKPGERA